MSQVTYFIICAMPLRPSRYEYFKKGGQLPSVKMSGGQLHFEGLALTDTWVALITFLYLDFMDGTSVMVGLDGTSVMV